MDERVEDVSTQLFSFGDVILASSLAAMAGALITGVIVFAKLRDVHESRQRAARYRREARELLRLAEQAPGGTDSWNADLLRRVALDVPRGRPAGGLRPTSAQHRL
jgi:hypothetical protein